MGHNILTYTHNYFDYIDIENNIYDMEEIAHSLANTCRFTGHTDPFYSVAQHSVLVSLHCPKKYAKEGLLHDAHEAYIGDINSPLKSLLPDYKALEKRIAAHFRKAYGLEETTSKIIKYSDLYVLRREQESFFNGYNIDEDPEWRILWTMPSYGIKIRALPPEKAKELFLSRANELWT